MQNVPPVKPQPHTQRPAAPDLQAQGRAQRSVRISEAAFEHSQNVRRHLERRISEAGGWLSFRDWMEDALYAPGLGYYAAGLRKIARRAQHNQIEPGADFVTAPELSPAFGYTIARQILQVMQTEGLTRILEFGPGTGQLACDILRYLNSQGVENIQYELLEISDDLRAQQQETLARQGFTAKWLNAIPENFEGVMLANEVLDAIPVHIVRWGDDASVWERGVAWADGDMVWEDRRAAPELAQTLAKRMPPLPGYMTELNPQAQAWVRTLADHLKKGLILLVDYGFPEKEYYHPQRAQGTLMCHIQHRAHDDPFFAPGLQDITAHVDFSAIARSAHEMGLDVLGYTSQARFLLNAGLPDILMQDEKLQELAHVRKVEILLSEAEMGELFKVMALGRDIHPLLSGFARSDRRHLL